MKLDSQGDKPLTATLSLNTALKAVKWGWKKLFKRKPKKEE